MVAACQVGRRQGRGGQHRSQGVPSTEAQPGVRETGRHPEREREREIQKQTDRPKEALSGTDRVEMSNRK